MRSRKFPRKESTQHLNYRNLLVEDVVTWNKSLYTPLKRSAEKCNIFYVKTYKNHISALVITTSCISYGSAWRFDRALLLVYGYGPTWATHYRVGFEDFQWYSSLKWKRAWRNFVNDSRVYSTFSENSLLMAQQFLVPKRH